MTRRQPKKLAQREDHPRERLFRHGAHALSNAELLEILLRNGCPGSTARKLARELLAEYGSLIGLAGLDRAFLHRRGIGKAKAATIMATFEIGPHPKLCPYCTSLRMVLGCFERACLGRSDSEDALGVLGHSQSTSFQDVVERVGPRRWIRGEFLTRSRSSLSL